MIGDLIPNITNDPKVSVETNKGSGEKASGKFSSLLKTIEQEINTSGNLENQGSGEQEIIDSSKAAEKSTIPFAPHLTDEETAAFNATADEESETSEEKNIEAGEISILVPQLLPNTQHLEQQSDLNPLNLDESKGEITLTTSIQDELVAQKADGDEQVSAIINNAQGNLAQAELVSNELDSKQTDTKLTNEADSVPGDVDSTEVKLDSELINSNSKQDPSLDQKHNSELNPADENANLSIGKAAVESAQYDETIQAISDANTSSVVKTNSNIDRHSEQASSFLSKRTFTQKNESITTIQQQNASQITSTNDGEDVANPMSFNTAKSSEILQAIQQNKAVAKVSKEVKSHRFALSNSEQAETRLKLLVDSARPEILANRELPADFSATTTDVELSEMFSTTGALTSEQELMLKDLMVETTSGKEAKTSEVTNFGFMRLNELTVMNTSARRSIVSSFGKVLQESLKSDQLNQSEQWQKHSFKLEEGNSIDLTTRNIDGVLHIKLAASNPELNRMLQSMEQEIKDHLKEELNLELDLQFNQSGNENDAESLQKGILNDKAKLAASQARELQKEESVKTNSGLNSSIRSFGYNQMEWTA